MDSSSRSATVAPCVHLTSSATISREGIASTAAPSSKTRERQSWSAFVRWPSCGTSIRPLNTNLAFSAATLRMSCALSASGDECVRAVRRSKFWSEPPSCTPLKSKKAPAPATSQSTHTRDSAPASDSVRDRKAPSRAHTAVAWWMCACSASFPSNTCVRVAPAPTWQVVRAFVSALKRSSFVNPTKDSRTAAFAPAPVEITVRACCAPLALRRACTTCARTHAASDSTRSGAFARAASATARASASSATQTTTASGAHAALRPHKAPPPKETRWGMDSSFTTSGSDACRGPITFKTSGGASLMDPTQLFRSDEKPRFLDNAASTTPSTSTATGSSSSAGSQGSRSLGARGAASASSRVGAHRHRSSKRVKRQGSCFLEGSTTEGLSSAATPSLLARATGGARVG